MNSKKRNLKPLIITMLVMIFSITTTYSQNGEYNFKKGMKYFSEYSKIKKEMGYNYFKYTKEIADQMNDLLDKAEQNLKKSKSQMEYGDSNIRRANMNLKTITENREWVNQMRKMGKQRLDSEPNDDFEKSERNSAKTTYHSIEKDEIIEEPIKEIDINNLKIGDLYAGGIIFKVDASGKHGFVCTPKDQRGFMTWLAANQCQSLTINSYSDWHLPSKHELNLMRTEIGQGSVIGNVAGFNVAGYWSSRECESDNSKAWQMNFNSGSWVQDGKIYHNDVRLVRAF